jgi:hypothetical protein
MARIEGLNKTILLVVENGEYLLKLPSLISNISDVKQVITTEYTPQSWDELLLRGVSAAVIHPINLINERDDLDTGIRNNIIMILLKSLGGGQIENQLMNEYESRGIPTFWKSGRSVEELWVKILTKLAESVVIK